MFLVAVIYFQFVSSKYRRIWHSCTSSNNGVHFHIFTFAQSHTRRSYTDAMWPLRCSSNHSKFNEIATKVVGEGLVVWLSRNWSQCNGTYPCQRLSAPYSTISSRLGPKQIIFRNKYCGLILVFDAQIRHVWIFKQIFFFVDWDCNTCFRHVNAICICLNVPTLSDHHVSHY